VFLNPSFFYFFNPIFVMRHAWTTLLTQTFVQDTSNQKRGS
jgi:hypothetical protein